QVEVDRHVVDRLVDHGKGAGDVGDEGVDAVDLGVVQVHVGQGAEARETHAVTELKILIEVGRFVLRVDAEAGVAGPVGYLHAAVFVCVLAGGAVDVDAARIDHVVVDLAADGQARPGAEVQHGLG